MEGDPPIHFVDENHSVDDVVHDSRGTHDSGNTLLAKCEPCYLEAAVDRRELTLTIDPRSEYKVLRRQGCSLCHNTGNTNIFDNTCTTSLTDTSRVKPSFVPSSTDLKLKQSLLQPLEAILGASDEDRKHVCIQYGTGNASIAQSDSLQIGLDNKECDIDRFPMQAHQRDKAACTKKTVSSTGDQKDMSSQILNSTEALDVTVITQPILCPDTCCTSYLHEQLDVIVSDGNGAHVVSTTERSYSTDDDGGRKTHVSQRLLERRKTIEIDKNDLSGLGVKHTSYLNVNIGLQKEQSDCSLKSEVNIIWGKTIDADNIASKQRLYRTDLHINSLSRRSLDDSTDYLSADISSDTIATSDFTDSFIETGDSLYASDSNDSFLEHAETIFDTVNYSHSLSYKTYQKHDSTNNADHEYKPRLVSTLSADLIQAYDVEPQNHKLPQTDFINNAQSPDTGHQVDKKLLYKVSDTIANLGRGANMETTAQRLRLFPEDCVDPSSGTVVDHDPEAEILFNRSSNYSSCTNEVQNVDVFNRTIQKSKEENSDGILRHSQEDIRDIKCDVNASLDVTNDQSDFQRLDNNSIRAISEGQSNNESGDIQAAVNPTRPSQEDVRLVQLEEYAQLTFSSMAGSDFLRPQDSGHLVLPQNFCTANVDYTSDSIYETTDKSLSVCHPGTTSFDSVFSSDSVKSVTTDYPSLNYNNIELKMSISDDCSDSQSIMNLHPNSKIAFDIQENRQRIHHNVDDHVSNNINLNIPGNAPEDVFHNNSVKNSTSLVYESNIPITAQAIQETVANFVDRSKVCLQKSSHVNVQNPTSTPSATQNIGTTEIQWTKVINANTHSSLLNATSREITEGADSLDNNDDGFVLVISRRKKKLQKKKKKLRPSSATNVPTVSDNGTDIIEAHCNTYIRRSSSDNGFDELENVNKSEIQSDTNIVYISAVSTEGALGDQSSHEPSLSTQENEYLDNNMEQSDMLISLTQTLEPSEGSEKYVLSEGDIMNVNNEEDITGEIIGENDEIKLSVFTSKVEEFICQILEGTDAPTQTCGDEFLHSDEQGGMLLNMYTGGHRRILKPHRRFTKLDRSSRSDESYSSLTDVGTKVTKDEIKVIEVSCVDIHPVNVFTYETKLDTAVAHKDNRNATGHHSKFKDVSKIDTNLAENDFSELNVSDSSASIDAPMDALKHVGNATGAYLMPVIDRAKSEKKGMLWLGEGNQLSDDANDKSQQLYSFGDMPCYNNNGAKADNSLDLPVATEACADTEDWSTFKERTEPIRNLPRGESGDSVCITVTDNASTVAEKKSTDMESSSSAHQQPGIVKYATSPDTTITDTKSSVKQINSVGDDDNGCKPWGLKPTDQLNERNDTGRISYIAELGLVTDHIHTKTGNLYKQPLGQVIQEHDDKASYFEITETWASDDAQNLKLSPQHVIQDRVQDEAELSANTDTSAPMSLMKHLHTVNRELTTSRERTVKNGFQLESIEGQKDIDSEYEATCSHSTSEYIINDTGIESRKVDLSSNSTEPEIGGESQHVQQSVKTKLVADIISKDDNSLSLLVISERISTVPDDIDMEENNRAHELTIDNIGGNKKMASQTESVSTTYIKDARNVQITKPSISTKKADIHSFTVEMNCKDIQQILETVHEIPGITINEERNTIEEGDERSKIEDTTCVKWEDNNMKNISDWPDLIHEFYDNSSVHENVEQRVQNVQSASGEDEGLQDNLSDTIQEMQVNIVSTVELGVTDRSDVTSESHDAEHDNGKYTIYETRYNKEVGTESSKEDLIENIDNLMREDIGVVKCESYAEEDKGFKNLKNGSPQTKNVAVYKHDESVAENSVTGDTSIGFVGSDGENDILCRLKDNAWMRADETGVDNEKLRGRDTEGMAWENGDHEQDCTKVISGSIPDTAAVNNQECFIEDRVEWRVQDPSYVRGEYFQENCEVRKDLSESIQEYSDENASCRNDKALGGVEDFSNVQRQENDKEECQQRYDLLSRDQKSTNICFFNRAENIPIRNAGKEFVNSNSLKYEGFDLKDVPRKDYVNRYQEIMDESLLNTIKDVINHCDKKNSEDTGDVKSQNNEDNMSTKSIAKEEIINTNVQTLESVTDRGDEIDSNGAALMSDTIPNTSECGQHLKHNVLYSLIQLSRCIISTSNMPVIADSHSSENTEYTDQKHFVRSRASTSSTSVAPFTDIKLQMTLSDLKQKQKKKKKKKNTRKNAAKRIPDQAGNVKDSLSEERTIGDAMGVAEPSNELHVTACLHESRADECLRGLIANLRMGDGVVSEEHSRADISKPDEYVTIADISWNWNVTENNSIDNRNIDNIGHTVEDVGFLHNDLSTEKEYSGLYNFDSLKSVQQTISKTESLNKSVLLLNTSNIYDYDPGLTSKLESGVKEHGDHKTNSNMDSSTDDDQAQQPTHTDSPIHDNALLPLDSHAQIETKDLSHLSVDRLEAFVLLASKPILSKNLVEDVVRSRQFVEQILAENPEASRRTVIHDFNTSSEGPTLTPAGHLMSEIQLLETSARDQLDILELAVSQQKMYDAELDYLSQAIDETQKNLQASPTTADSVGDLKKLMAERNKLSEEIKQYHTQINEVNEKIRQLALDSAQLSPSIFRKHYHPESAYSDYFAAMSQHKRGAIPFHPSGQLFYDSLPDFDVASLSDLESPSFLVCKSEDELENWKQTEQQKSTYGHTPISLELPRLIPPPRTDSIPRPTWSGEIFSTAASTSDLSRGTRTLHSIHNPKTMAAAFQTSASTSKSVSSVSASAKKPDQVNIPVANHVAGPDIFPTHPNQVNIPATNPVADPDIFPREPDQVNIPAANHVAGADIFPTQPNQVNIPAAIHVTGPDIFKSSEAFCTGATDSGPGVSIATSEPSNILQFDDEYSSPIISALPGTLVFAVSEQNETNTGGHLPDTVHGCFNTQEISSSNNWNRSSECESATKESALIGLMSTISQSRDSQQLGLNPNKYGNGSELVNGIEAACDESKQGTLGEELYKQNAAHEQQKDVSTLEACRKQVLDTKVWLQEIEGQQISMTLPLEDYANLQAHMLENVGIQTQINKQLQNLSDLILQCGSLSEQEDSLAAENIRSDCLTLQINLEQLKQTNTDKQFHLEVALSGLLNSGTDKTNEFAEDIKYQQQLNEISNQGSHKESPASIVTISDEIRKDWKRLSKDLEQKQEHLECVLKTQKPEDLVKISLLAPAKHADCTKELENVEKSLADFNSVWNLQKVELNKKQSDPKKVLMLQQQHQSALHSISNWLDSAEQQLFSVPLTTDEQIKQNENFKKQIQTLQDYISRIKEQTNDQILPTTSSDREIIEKCHSSLSERARMINTTAELQAEDLHQTERQWKQYQREITTLQGRLQDIEKLILLPTATQTLDQLLTNNQKTETQLKICEDQLQELNTKESSLTQKYPKGLFMSELMPVQSKYIELHRKAVEKKSDIQTLVTSRDQYQQMLQDCASFLQIAEDKLLEHSVSAKDLSDLKQQLAAHMEFFNDIEVQSVILNSLANNCDPSTRNQFEQQNSDLSTRIDVLVDQASLHGQRLDHLIHLWDAMEGKHTILDQLLLSLETQMPDVVDSRDSLATIQDKCNKYRWLQGELAAIRDSVFEAVENGKQILHSVSCPILEATVTKLTEKWVYLNTKLTQELKRTESLGDLLSVFEAEIAVLSSWLLTARMKLSSFKQLSEASLQSISIVRKEVEKILEFRKDVANQLSFKKQVLSKGNQLLQTKSCDTRGLSSRLQNCDEEWQQLEKDISETQEHLLQVQMKLMPSWQALKELTDWIMKLRKSLEKDACVVNKGAVVIESMIKKYKGYQIELAGRQLSLDFVNQLVIKPQSEEVTVLNEKLEFVENLKNVNKHWHKVTTIVNDTLNQLQDVYNKWEKYGSTVEKLQSWLHQQEDKIQRYKLIGNETGVKQALKDCTVLQQQLQAKQSELLFANDLSNYLIVLNHDSPDSQQSVREKILALDHSIKRLEEQTRQRQNTLKVVLDLWTQYHGDLASINQLMTQAGYALGQYKLIKGDITILQSQVTKLKNIHTNFEKNSGLLESFSVLASQLRQVCEPSVQNELQKTLSSIQNKWKHLTTDLIQRSNNFQEHLDEWQQFEDQYSRIQDWLNTKEVLCGTLVGINTDSVRPETLRECKQLQQDLDILHTQISDLHKRSGILTKNMNPSAVSIVMSQQSAIDLKLLALKQRLSQFLAAVSSDLAMREKFKNIFETVKKFLNSAKAILECDDPTKVTAQEVIQERCDQLSSLLQQFIADYKKLDDINDLGYRLALSDFDATNLRELNHRWHGLYKDARDRIRTLQSYLLHQQNFTIKCEAWKNFFSQAKTHLTEGVKMNLSDLSDQLHSSLQFEHELFNQQLIIRAIISDGQNMILEGEVEDKDEFQRKLSLFSEQWQNLYNEANKRKVITENLVSQWHAFNTYSQQLKDWLKDTENYIISSQSDHSSLQAVKNSMQKLQATKQEFQVQETTYNKILELGDMLLKHTDDYAAKEIKETLSHIQGHWHKVLTVLEEHRLQIEDVDCQWLDCESMVDAILCQVTEIRSILNADIPTTYDELQTEISRCKDIEYEFIKSEHKEHQLVAKKHQLARVVQSESISLLNERIQLLMKQKQELKHLAEVKKGKLNDALSRFQHFNEQLQSLTDWIDNMTVNLISNHDMPVEDVLAKLEYEYKQEADKKEFEKTLITEQGKQLMAISSGVRASEIEHKLLQLQNKWENFQNVMGTRVCKLREVVQALKQLDINMRNLSEWLSAVEHALNAEITLKSSDLKEVQAILQESKELQQDIARHTTSVSAVLDLCEILLSDSDACPTEVELLALQHSKNNLEKRWQTICMAASQKMTRIEDIWQQSENLRADCDKFIEWITQVENEVDITETEASNIKAAQTLLKKYEDIQCNLHNHLSDLEHINHEYCQLIKDGLPDFSGAQKVLMTKLNERWDTLQFKVAEIVKKLCSSSSIREDFETTQISLMKWLTEIDVQLTNLQHSTELNLQTKTIEIKRIDEDVCNKYHRIKYLDQAGKHLIQKADSQGALRVQKELDNFRSLHKSVLDHLSLVKLQFEHMLVKTEDKTVQYNSEDRHQQLYGGFIGELQNVKKTDGRQQKLAEMEKFPESLYAKSHLHSDRKSMIQSRTSSKPESSAQKSHSPFFMRSVSLNKTINKSVSPPSKLSPSRYAVDVGGEANCDIINLEKSAKIDVLMEQLVETLDDCNVKLARLERTHEHFEDTDQSMYSLVECEAVIEDVKTLDRLLKTELDLSTIASVDAQVESVLERWKYLHKYVKEKNAKLVQERNDLLQLENNIDDVLTWLEDAEDFQTTNKYSFTDVDQLEDVARQCKEFLTQMKKMKAAVMFINQHSVIQKYQRSKFFMKKHLQEKLRDMNRRWELILSWSSDIQKYIKSHSIQHQEFINMIDDCQLWLEKTETQIRHCEPVNSSPDESVLLENYTKLKELQSDVVNNQAKILALKEKAALLLRSRDLQDFSTARDKIYIVHKRVQTLIPLVSSYISVLENRLKTQKSETPQYNLDMSEGKSSGIESSYKSRSSTPLQSGFLTLRAGSRSPFAISQSLFSEIPFGYSRAKDIENSSTEPKPRKAGAENIKDRIALSLLARVIKTALFIQLLLLLFCLLFCLIPKCEDENSCMHVNNLQHYIMPVLQYTDGAPPV